MTRPSSSPLQRALLLVALLAIAIAACGDRGPEGPEVALLCPGKVDTVRVYQPDSSYVENYRCRVPAVGAR